MEAENAPEECVEIIENVMVMADSIDQSLQTLRSQLNLVTFNLRTEVPSEEKYEQVLEMLRNLQYLRITVNRPVSHNEGFFLFYSKNSKKNFSRS